MRLHGSNQWLAGYLVEEVMTHLPLAVQEFLQRTALPVRFCAPLADALLADSPPTPASQMIGQLVEQNLFLIPLDAQGEWYRYHDLFRDFLRHRLQSTVGTVGARPPGCAECLLLAIVGGQ